MLALTTLVFRRFFYPMTSSDCLRTLESLRSRRWFADVGIRGFAHRQRMQQQGWRRADMMDKTDAKNAFPTRGRGRDGT